MSNTTPNAFNTLGDETMLSGHHDSDPDATQLGGLQSNTPPTSTAPASFAQPQSSQQRANPAPSQSYVPPASTAPARFAQAQSFQQPANPAQSQSFQQPVFVPQSSNGPQAPTRAAAVPAIGSFAEFFQKIVHNVGTAVVGKEKPIKLCITALIAGGHVLLEDNPGTGKTQLARALANSISTSFKRIQFTPDLLPSDVVGVTFYNQERHEFRFREGPVFASIVLADEINRASPKTQSALLEVMEEEKVTVDGTTYEVPQPFMVIATQNPVEQLGTYHLPEAQMDRFLIKTSIGYPSHEHSLEILKQVNVTDRAATVGKVASAQEVLFMRKQVEEVRIDDSILEYIVRLVDQTRHHEMIAVGASTRGALALTRCARVWAAADGRAYVVPDDVKELAQAVLAHRIVPSPDASFAGRTAEQLLDEVIASVPVPTGV